MPCTQTGSITGDLELSLAEARKAATLSARVACEALTALERESVGFYNHMAGLSKETKAWWKKHQNLDLKGKAVTRRKKAPAKKKVARSGGYQNPGKKSYGRI